MAPFFTIVVLWIGALLVGVSLHTDVSPNVGQRYLDSVAARKHPDTAANADTNAAKPSRSVEPSTESGEIRPTPAARLAVGAAVKNPVFIGAQEYLGRYFMFWATGVTQSTLLMIGLIMFMEIEPAYPFLLILAGWIVSTAFTNIVYMLVTVLFNVGKALIMMLLVLQISAVGGAYPLELLPQQFQNISPQLPTTYAISLARSATAGIYAKDFAYNSMIVLLFLVPSLALGLVLWHTIAGRIHDMNKAIEEAGAMQPELLKLR